MYIRFLDTRMYIQKIVWNITIEQSTIILHTFSP